MKPRSPNNRRGSSRPGPESQTGKILRALRQARPRWVSMPQLVRASRSYNIHSRIDELRHRYGVRIENRLDISVRPHKSHYRLL